MDVSDYYVVVEDQLGQLLYGVETFSRTDLLTENNVNIDDLARRTLETRSPETAPRVRSVMLDARNGDDQVDLMTLADVHKPSHYRCRLEEERGLIFDDRYMATALIHTITATSWSLQMNLDLAAPYMAIGAKWDTSRWDESEWTDLDALLAEARETMDRIEALT